MANLNFLLVGSKTNPVLMQGVTIKGNQLKNEIIIGLTHKDICFDIHNKKNYGIIGLSFLGKQVCIG